VRGRLEEPLARRLASKIEIEAETLCWLWKGARDKDGYGTFWLKRTNYRAHRLLYEIVKGPISDELQIDHICRVRRCVNPFHLEPVICLVNISRGQTGVHNARKAFCSKGHPYDETNMRLVKTYQGYGMFGRQCRECDRLRKAALRARMSAAGFKRTESGQWIAK